MTFNTLGLSEPLLTAVSEQKYTQPTPIQMEAIPAVLSGRDVMAAAQTGTGKTASFTLPVLDRLMKGPRVKPNQARALILTPTRELAAQIDESVKAYGKHVDLRSTVVFGGVKINPQMMRLRRGVDILVATPGRLLDLYNQNAISFKQLEILVLDEADRMLDMGFINDIRKIIALLPSKRQNLLFSATFSSDIRNLAKSIVNQPIEISVTPPNTTAQTVKQTIFLSDKASKPELLAHLIEKHRWMQVLVFTRTKHGANRLAQYLEKSNIDAAAIHGNKSQGARTRALAEFKNGKIQVLVATDIAARGLDIEQLPQVVNFELPNVPEDYIHRIGRTGRAGESGQAVSLVCSEESKYLRDIERLIKTDFKRKIVEGFEPTEDFSNPNKKPPAKAQQQRGEHRSKRHGDSRGQQSSGKPGASRKPGGFKGKRKQPSQRSRSTANA